MILSGGNVEPSRSRRHPVRLKKFSTRCGLLSALLAPISWWSATGLICSAFKGRERRRPDGRPYHQIQVVSPPIGDEDHAHR